MLRLVKAQGTNLYIIGEVVFVTGIYRHGFLGVGVWFGFFSGTAVFSAAVFSGCGYRSMSRAKLSLLSARENGREASGRGG